MALPTVLTPGMPQPAPGFPQPMAAPGFGITSQQQQLGALVPQLMKAPTIVAPGYALPNTGMQLASQLTGGAVGPGNDPHQWTPDQAQAQTDRALARIAQVNPQLAQTLAAQQGKAVDNSGESFWDKLKSGFGEVLHVTGLATVLDYMGRSSHIVPEVIHDWGKESVWKNVSDALLGRSTTTWSNVLQDNFGIHNKVIDAIGGFIGDLATDPLTWATFGAGAVAKEASARVLTEAAAETLVKKGGVVEVTNLVGEKVTTDAGAVFADIGRTIGSNDPTKIAKAILGETEAKVNESAAQAVIARIRTGLGLGAPEAVPARVFTVEAATDQEAVRNIIGVLNDVYRQGTTHGFKGLSDELAAKMGIDRSAVEATLKGYIKEGTGFVTKSAYTQGKEAASVLGGIRLRGSIGIPGLSLFGLDPMGLRFAAAAGPLALLPSSMDFSVGRRFFAGISGEVRLEKMVAEGHAALSDLRTFWEGGYSKLKELNSPVADELGKGKRSMFYSASEAMGGFTEHFAPHAAQLRGGGLAARYAGQVDQQSRHMVNQIINETQTLTLSDGSVLSPPQLAERIAKGQTAAVKAVGSTSASTAVSDMLNEYSSVMGHAPLNVDAKTYFDGEIAKLREYAAANPEDATNVDAVIGELTARSNRAQELEKQLHTYTNDPQLGGIWRAAAKQHETTLIESGLVPDSYDTRILAATDVNEAEARAHGYGDTQWHSPNIDSQSDLGVNSVGDSGTSGVLARGVHLDGLGTLGDAPVTLSAEMHARLTFQLRSMNDDALAAKVGANGAGTLDQVLNGLNDGEVFKVQQALDKLAERDRSLLDNAPRVTTLDEAHAAGRVGEASRPGYAMPETAPTGTGAPYVSVMSHGAGYGKPGELRWIGTSEKYGGEPLLVQQGAGDTGTVWAYHHGDLSTKGGVIHAGGYDQAEMRAWDLQETPKVTPIQVEGKILGLTDGNDLLSDVAANQLEDGAYHGLHSDLERAGMPENADPLTWLKEQGYVAVAYRNEGEGGGVAIRVLDPSAVRVGHGAPGEVATGSVAGSAAAKRAAESAAAAEEARRFGFLPSPIEDMAARGEVPKYTSAGEAARGELGYLGMEGEVTVTANTARHEVYGGEGEVAHARGTYSHYTGTEGPRYISGPRAGEPLKGHYINVQPTAEARTGVHEAGHALNQALFDQHPAAQSEWEALLDAMKKPGQSRGAAIGVYATKNSQEAFAEAYTRWRGFPSDAVLRGGKKVGQPGEVLDPRIQAFFDKWVPTFRGVHPDTGKPLTPVESLFSRLSIDVQSMVEAQHGADGGLTAAERRFAGMPTVVPMGPQNWLYIDRSTPQAGVARQATEVVDRVAEIHQQYRPVLEQMANGSHELLDQMPEDTKRIIMDALGTTGAIDQQLADITTELLKADGYTGLRIKHDGGDELVSFFDQSLGKAPIARINPQAARIAAGGPQLRAVSKGATEAILGVQRNSGSRLITKVLRETALLPREEAEKKAAELLHEAGINLRPGQSFFETDALHILEESSHRVANRVKDQYIGEAARHAENLGLTRGGYGEGAVGLARYRVVPDKSAFQWATNESEAMQMANANKATQMMYMRAARRHVAHLEKQYNQATKALADLQDSMPARVQAILRDWAAGKTRLYNNGETSLFREATWSSESATDYVNEAEKDLNIQLKTLREGGDISTRGATRTIRDVEGSDGHILRYDQTFQGKTRTIYYYVDRNADGSATVKAVRDLSPAEVRGRESALAVTRPEFQHQGLAGRLVDQHWRDAGITTGTADEQLQKMAEALMAQSHTGEGAAFAEATLKRNAKRILSEAKQEGDKKLGELKAAKRTLDRQNTALQNAAKEVNAIAYSQQNARAPILAALMPAEDAMNLTGMSVLHIPGFEGMAMPDFMAQEFQQAVRGYKGLGAAHAHFRQLNNLWKTWATWLFPGFHVRNLEGASFNNWLGGVQIHDYVTSGRIARAGREIESGAEGKWASMRIASKEPDLIKALQKSVPSGLIMGVPLKDLTYGDLYELHSALGLTAANGRLFAEAQLSAEAEAIKYTKAASKRPGFIKGIPKPYTTAMKKAGTLTENTMRSAAFIRGLRDGRSLMESRMWTMMRHGDYEDLTDWEYGFVRDLIPFYKWTRTNLPFQIHQLLESPAKLLGVQKVQTAAYTAAGVDPNVAKAQLPQWLAQEFKVPFGAHMDKGQAAFNTVTLDLPYRDLFMGGNEFLSSFLPTIRPFIENVVGTSFFSGKPLTGKAVPLNPLFDAFAPFLKMTGLAKEGPDGLFISDKTANILGIIPVYSRFKDWITSDPSVSTTKANTFASAVFGMGVRQQDAAVLASNDLNFYYTNVLPTLTWLRDVGYPLPTTTDLQHAGYTTDQILQAVGIQPGQPTQAPQAA